MDLNLLEKFNEEEQNELKRRIFSAMNQMILEGVSIGRELQGDDLHFETEKFIQEKILFLSNYFLDDRLWRDQPPADYRDIKVVPKYDPENSILGATVEKVEEGKDVDVNNPTKDKSNENRPEWSKNEEKPDWADKEKPFN